MRFFYTTQYFNNNICCLVGSGYSHCLHKKRKKGRKKEGKKRTEKKRKNEGMKKETERTPITFKYAYKSFVY